MFIMTAIFGVVMGGQPHILDQVQVKARTREECMEVAQHALQNPYVLSATCAPTSATTH